MFLKHFSMLLGQSGNLLVILVARSQSRQGRMCKGKGRTMLKKDAKK